MEKEQGKLLHRYMKENHAYYRSWAILDEKLNEWLKNPKLKEGQKKTITKLLNCALLLRAEIEMSDSNGYDFDFFDGLIRNMEAEKKEILSDRNIFRKKLHEADQRIKKLEKENEILIKEIEFNAET